MSLALYRRYRPDTFDEVIGQDHVTGPLKQALASGRINHAFLFSGPRGCGKTTSARILARCLNCEQGPTPTPCGECQSCQDLANGGPGSLDVIEIDAASHGGVDDARELRERAFYAPVSSRYKVYIIDEAHMVTREGFNALLKLVEEPPEHLKFVFATTEPDKVLATIRSRTHHYAFRLVPPRVLTDHLANVLSQEGVKVDDNVLPMVVRAGAGSVRDALSVLDQLVAGSEGDTITYPYAAALLGYTDAALLDAVVDAFASRRGSEVFETLDRALDSGLDPRRFVADLLERFRDLVVISAVGSNADDITLEALIDASPELLGRMREQAKEFGPAELTRNAELLATGLIEMRGATAPRLALELLASRLLLPGAEPGERGLQVRLEQLERRVSSGAVAAAPAMAPPTRAAAPTQAAAPAAPAPPAPKPATAAPAQQAAQASAPPAPSSPAAAAPPTAPAAEGGAVAIDEVRRMWPQILESVKSKRRATWMLLIDSADVLSVSDRRLALALAHAGAVKGFTENRHGDTVKLAIIDVMGVDLDVDAVVSPSRANSPTVRSDAPEPTATASPSGEPPKRGNRAPDRSTIAAPPAEPEAPAEANDAVHADSEDALSGEELLAQALDAKPIGEISTE